MNDLINLIESRMGFLTPFTSPSLGFWSPLIFWFVAINAVLTGLFTLVVIVGGVFDLHFLFKALNEESVDETDDGRVIARGPGDEENQDG